MNESSLRAHPAYTRLFRIYRNAVADWHANDPIQDAAHTLGMNARAYANSRLYANQMSWSSNNTSGELTQAHLDIAYEDAVRDVCGLERGAA